MEEARIDTISNPHPIWQQVKRTASLSSERGQCLISMEQRVVLDLDFSLFTSLLSTSVGLLHASYTTYIPYVAVINHSNAV